MAAVKSTLSLDVQPFREGLSKASVGISAFQADVTKLESSLKRQANAWSGRSLIANAEIQAKAITAIGGASKLTASELSRLANTLNEAERKSKATGLSMSADVKKLTDEVNKLHAAANKSSSGGGGIGGSLLAGLGLGSGAAVGLTALNALQSQLGAVYTESRKIAQLRAPFEQYSGGVDKANVKLVALREATLGLVSTSALMQQSNQASTLGLDKMGIQFTEVARVATILGRAVGNDTTQSVSDLTNGLAKGSAELLNNLGVIIRSEDAYKTYAARIGKTADTLTDLERQTAVATIGMEKATEKANALGDASLTAWDHLDKIGVTLMSIGSQAGSSAGEWQPLINVLKEVSGYLDLIQKYGGQGVAATIRNGITGNITSGAINYGNQRMANGWSNLKNLNPAGFIDIINGGLYGGLGYGLAAAGGLSPVLMDPAAAPTRPIGAAAPGVTLPKGALPPIPRKLSDADVKKATAEAKRKADAIAKENGKRIARETEDALRSAQTAVLTTFSSNLWKGSGLLQPRTSNALVSGLAGRGTNGFGALTSGYASQLQRFQTRNDGGIIGSTNPLNAVYLPGAVTSNAGTIRKELDAAQLSRDIARIDRITSAFSGVSQTLSQIAQVSDSPGMNRFAAVLGGITGGTALSGQLMSSFGASDSFRASAGGRALSGGLSGLTAGMSVGGMFTNRGLGFAAGAGAGAAAGAAGGWWGAGIGALVGGFAGMYSAAATAKGQRRAKDASAAQLTAQFGGLDETLNLVARLGLNQQSFLEGFYGSPSQYAKEVTKLNEALEAERIEANKLAKALDAVARSQRVMSVEQAKLIKGSRRGGAADEDLFAFLQGQTDNLIGGLEGYLSSGAVNAGGGGAAGYGLGASFQLLQQQGLSTVEILERLRPAIEAYKKNVVDAGKGSTAEFDGLNTLLSTMSDQTLAPFINGATSAAQILSSLGNTGFLTAEAFMGLSGSIAESWKALEANGRGAEAISLLQGPLQSVWEQWKDNGMAVDDTTKSILEFMETNGKIGDAFRSPADQMQLALEKLTERLGDFISAMERAVGLTRGFQFDVPDLPRPGPKDTPGFAGGSGGLVNFGKETLARLHGWEAVLTKGQYDSLMGLAARGLSPAGMGGSAPIYIQTVTTLDGREIARSTARHTPTVARQYAR